MTRPDKFRRALGMKPMVEVLREKPRPEAAIDRIICWNCAPWGEYNRTHPKPFICVRCGRLYFFGEEIKKVTPDMVGIAVPVEHQYSEETMRRLATASE